MQAAVDGIWQVGCEFIVGEIHSRDEFSSLHGYLRLCYQIAPDPEWTQDDVQSGGLLNMTTLTAHYGKHSNASATHLSDTIASYNNQYPQPDIGLNCNHAESGISHDSKQIEEQFAYALKYDCNISLLLDTYRGVHNFNQQFQLQLMGIAWKFENFYGVQTLSQAFNVSMWHRAIAHSYKLHDDAYYQSVINSIGDTHLKSVLNTVFLSESRPSNSADNKCQALCSRIYSDLDQTSFIALQNSCERAINHYTVHNLIEYVNRYMHVSDGRIKIYIAHTNIRDSFYSPLRLGDPMRHEVAFVSSKPEARFPLLLHELGHLFLHKLFRYQEKPYTRHDHSSNSTLYNDFILAKSRFISDFCSQILGLACSKVEDFKSKEIVLAAKAYFHHSLDERRLALQYLRLISATLIQVDRGSKPDARLAALSAWVQNRWGPRHKDIIHFIHRMFDWAARPAYMQDAELINRLPEFRAHILDQRVLNTLVPLEAFWEKHISPLLKSKATFPNESEAIFHKNSPTALYKTVGIAATIICTFVIIAAMVRSLYKRSQSFAMHSKAS